MYYKIEIDWIGDKYIGISLKWDYNNKTLDTSISNYVMSNLKSMDTKK